MYRNEKIRGKQAELGLSNDALAEKAGVNINTVSTIRQGRNVQVDTLEKVVTALGLTLVEVFEPKPTPVKEADLATAGAG